MMLATCSYIHPKKNKHSQRMTGNRQVKVFSCSMTNCLAYRQTLISVDVVFVHADVCIMCMHLTVAHVHVWVFFRGGWLSVQYVNTCVYVQIVSGFALGVFHVYKLYRQLGQFLSLCLMNGLPLAPLCRELRSVCSCSFCTSCTVHTKTIYFSDVHTYPNTFTETRRIKREQQQQQRISIELHAHNNKKTIKIRHLTVT